MATTDVARRSDLPGRVEELENDLTTVGNRVAWARMSKHLTQLDLAKMVDKSRQTIMQYELGGTTPPIEVVEKFAKIFNLTPEFIAFGRNGVDGVKTGKDMVPITEIKVGRDAEFADGGHALSRKMLSDFGLEENKSLNMFVLTHSAPAFDMKAGTRVLVSEADNKPTRDYNLYLIRSGDGLDVVRLESDLMAKPGEIAVTTGNGNQAHVSPSAIDIIGAIVSSIRPHSMK